MTCFLNLFRKFCNNCEENFSVALGFCLTDSGDLHKFLLRFRLEAAHIDERRVGENDISRYALAHGKTFSQIFERGEELFVRRRERSVFCGGSFLFLRYLEHHAQRLLTRQNSAALRREFEYRVFVALCGHVSVLAEMVDDVAQPLFAVVRHYAVGRLSAQPGGYQPLVFAPAQDIANYFFAISLTRPCDA